MAAQNSIKKDLENAGRQIDALNRLYNVYFQGGEDDPPRPQRQALDNIIVTIKSQLPSLPNASDKFQANSVISRYQIVTAKWDKTLRGIEQGTIVRPKKRQ